MVKAINRTKEVLFEEVKDVPFELPEGWKWVKLEDIVEINPKSINPVRDFGEETFTYIDINSVENYTGKITNPKTIVGKKAPSRARRLIKHKDILLSTVRPYLMAHAFVSSEYENQVCSTGFTVLRVKNEKQVYPKYLWFCLFSEALLRQYERLMMGASYPALNNNQVKALVIPLPFKNAEPDLEKQRQIVEKIEVLFKEIDKAIELRQKAIEETKSLFDSVLDKVFREAEKDEEMKWTPKFAPLFYHPWLVPPFRIRSKPHQAFYNRVSGEAFPCCNTQTHSLLTSLTSLRELISCK